MSTQTPNYGLTKPTEATDFVDIDVLNTNMDIIDEQMKATSDLVSSVWEAYTPVLINWGVGNGVLHGRKRVVGKTVFWSAYFKLGSASVASGTLFMSLPATPEVTDGAAITPVGIWTAQDSSTGKEYGGICSCSGSNNTRFVVPSGDFINTTTAIFPFAINDIIRANGQFETS